MGPRDTCALTRRRRAPERPTPRLAADNGTDVRTPLRYGGFPCSRSPASGGHERMAAIPHEEVTLRVRIPQLRLGGIAALCGCTAPG